MPDDFCLEHGYEFMHCEKVWGAIPYCKECDREKTMELEQTRDANLPTCARCDAKVHNPCTTAFEAKRCELPDFCFPNGRRVSHS